MPKDQDQRPLNPYWRRPGPSHPARGKALDLVVPLPGDLAKAIERAGRPGLAKERGTP